MVSCVVGILLFGALINTVVSSSALAAGEIDVKKTPGADGKNDKGLDEWGPDWLNAQPQRDALNHFLTEHLGQKDYKPFIDELLGEAPKKGTPEERKKAYLAAIEKAGLKGECESPSGTVPALWSGGSAKSDYAQMKNQVPLEATKMGDVMGSCFGNSRFPKTQPQKDVWMQYVAPLFDAISVVFCSSMKPPEGILSIYTSQVSPHSTFRTKELPQLLENKDVKFLDFYLMPGVMAAAKPEEKLDWKKWEGHDILPYAQIRIPATDITEADIDATLSAYFRKPEVRPVLEKYSFNIVNQNRDMAFEYDGKATPHQKACYDEFLGIDITKAKKAGENFEVIKAADPKVVEPEQHRDPQMKEVYTKTSMDRTVMMVGDKKPEPAIPKAAGPGSKKVAASFVHDTNYFWPAVFIPIFIGLRFALKQKKATEISLLAEDEL